MTRVLVIEDTTDLREELVDYLHFRGYGVQGVGSLAAMQGEFVRASMLFEFNSFTLGAGHPTPYPLQTRLCSPMDSQAPQFFQNSTFAW